MSKRASSGAEKRASGGAEKRVSFAAGPPALLCSFSVPPPARQLEQEEIEISVADSGPAKKLKATLRAGSLEYASVTQPMPRGSTFYIGTLKSDGHLSLRKAVPLRMAPAAAAQAEEEGEAEKAAGTTAEARRRLTELFGSRKARMAERAKEKGALRAKGEAAAPREPVAPREAAERASSVSAKADLAATGVPRALLPAYDVDTEDPAAVFDMGSLTLGVLSRIPRQELTEMEAAVRKPGPAVAAWRADGTAPEFLCLALEEMASRRGKAEEEKAAVEHKARLALMLCMYYYFHQKPPGSLGGDVAKLAASIGATPPIATAILEAFAERADAHKFSRPQALVDKSIAHILILVLAILDYKMPEAVYSALARDLRLTLPKLVLYARSVGCVKDGPSLDLRAPLHFPLVRKKAAAR